MFNFDHASRFRAAQTGAGVSFAQTEQCGYAIRVATGVLRHPKARAGVAAFSDAIRCCPSGNWINSKLILLLREHLNREKLVISGNAKFLHQPGRLKKQTSQIRWLEPAV
jgi:hypothetical protein